MDKNKTKNYLNLIGVILSIILVICCIINYFFNIETKILENKKIVLEVSYLNEDIIFLENNINIIVLKYDEKTKYGRQRIKNTKFKNKITISKDEFNDLKNKLLNDVNEDSKENLNDVKISGISELVIYIDKDKFNDYISNMPDMKIKEGEK